MGIEKDKVLALTATVLFLHAFGLVGIESLTSAESLGRAVEYWFFDHRGSPSGLVACLAGWMVWNRATMTIAGDDKARLPWVGALAIASVGSFLWAQLNEAPDLLFVTLALVVACAAGQIGGTGGLRTIALPMVVLMVAIPIPYPLSNEIVWSMQNASAAGTTAVLHLLGSDIVRSGAHLSRSDVSFLVVEGCSGLRSILTLTLVAVVARELFGHGRSIRTWIPVMIAPAIGLSLNIVRISAIVLSTSESNATIAQDHTSQGLAVIGVGTVLIFFLSRYCAPSPSDEGHRGFVDGGVMANQLPKMVALLATMSLVRLVVQPWPVAVTDLQGSTLPQQSSEWTGEHVSLDYEFLGDLPRGAVVQRTYRSQQPIDRLGHRPVDFLLATAPRRAPRGSPFSSKLIVPGRDWQIDETSFARIFVLGRRVSVSKASSADQKALIYSWSTGGDGFWLDSIRSLLAIERGPFERTRARTFIRIATAIGDEPEGESHAKAVLDRFVYDFRQPLRSI